MALVLFVSQFRASAMSVFVVAWNYKVPHRGILQTQNLLNGVQDGKGRPTHRQINVMLISRSLLKYEECRLKWTKSDLVLCLGTVNSFIFGGS